MVNGIYGMGGLRIQGKNSGVNFWNTTFGLDRWMISQGWLIDLESAFYTTSQKRGCLGINP